MWATYISVTTAQPSYCIMKAATDRMWTKGYGCAPVKFSLRTLKFEFCVIFTCHEMLFFFQSFSFFKKRFYLFIYFERDGKGGGKRGRETRMCKRDIHWLPLPHPQPGTWPAIQACALTGNRTGNPLIRRRALNPLSHTSQGSIFFNHFNMQKPCLAHQLYKTRQWPDVASDREFADSCSSH